MSEKHIFAVFYPRLPLLHEGDSYTFVDKDLFHRVINVIRLTPDEDFIVFDQTAWMQCTLLASQKKGVLQVRVCEVQLLTPLVPEIHLYQGILRREAFDVVAYAAAQMGITSFTPLLTQKSQRSWQGSKELERVRNVMIAACEQSKQFCLPTINEPQSMDSICTSSPASSYRLYCDPDGKSLLTVLNDLVKVSAQSIHVVIGPEGGFADTEMKLLNDNKFVRCALTPTMLRSCDAAMVCLGALRSSLRSASV